jgi:DNA-3-methyladenine glycosylase I
MRCDWAIYNPLLQKYHDEEWGVPVHDDQLLFEHLALDIFQAGLSWLTILNKRKNFRIAFENFAIDTVAGFGDMKINELIANQAIIRNHQKIEAVITNARCIIEIQKDYGSFDAYIWQFTGGQTIHNAYKKITDLPANTPQSDAMSRDLRKMGFRFTGSTICYAFMQATGMVNDHLTGCFRYKPILEMNPYNQKNSPAE